MKKVKGFTLIELLIVVAIIAILAAIAVPNFLEAQIRSKVSRAHADMRSLATAIEAYMVDANTYPASASRTDAIPTVNSGLRTPSAGVAGARDRCTFRINISTTEPMMSLTSPVAQITTYPQDPFATTKGAIFGYANAAEMGWIIWSYGPDGDEGNQGDLDPASTEAADNVDEMKKLSGKDNGTDGAWSYNSIYNPRMSNPTMSILINCTYDPTNGSTSDGDVWRVRQ